MDVLSDVLQVVRLTGSIFFRADLYHPWSVSSPPSDLLLQHIPAKAECVSLFHIIIAGECWFKTETGKPFLVGKDSLVIFPHSSSHIMCSKMDVSPVPVMRLLSPENLKEFVKVEYGGGGDTSEFICGYLFCDQKFNPLLGATPEVLIISRNAGDIRTQTEKKNPEIFKNTIQIEDNSWLDISLKQLVKEVNEKRTGSLTIITRLTELMYIEILRQYMKNLPEKSDGWLAGLRDAEVGRALKYLHAHPEEKWNVEMLAKKVGVSRSAFAQRFTNLIGEAPMQYLTGWRMQLAKRFLLEPDLSLAMVAEKIGYDSDIAFNRAFKRHVGQPPSSWRDHARFHLMT